jgi:hypothetical protein
VFFTVEFAAELHKRGYENVVVITEKFCPETKKITEVMGYKYLLIEEVENKNMKFDVIVGNPPYDGVYKGLQSPWPKFSKKAIELLKDNGVVCFITPLSWMSPSSELFTLFKKYQLELADITIGSYFKVGSTFSFWKLKKTEDDEYITKFINSNGTFDLNLSNYDFLPNTQNKTIFSILEKAIFSYEGKINVNVSSELHTQNKPYSETKNSKFQFLARHTNTSNYYFENKSDNYSLPKITFCITGNFEPRFDNGEMGTCQNTMWIPCLETEQTNMINYLKESKIIRFIFQVCKWSGANNRNLIRTLPCVTDYSKIWTDGELYAHFNLTQEEIDYIEANVK